MALLDIFNDDAFSLTSLTATINEQEVAPGRLGQLGLFTESGISTTTAVVESSHGELRLLSTGERGKPAPQATGTKRKVRSFVIPHIPYDSTILAAEVSGIRAFGSEDTFQGVQSVVNGRLMKMNKDHEITLEHLRVGALKGKILDADGSSVIYDLFAEFGVTQQIHTFALSNAATDVRKEAIKARRKVDKALGAQPYTGLRALCGPEFYDDLVTNEDVKKTYERYQEGAMLRNDPKGGFQYADIFWEEYKGTVNGTPFIPDDEALLFPEGTDIFQTWFAPADFLETVNTIGLPRYAKQKVMDFDKGVQIHTQSNPLPINLKPRAVIRLKKS